MNDKIPKGEFCETSGEDCPCLYDMMYCQLFNKGLEYGEDAGRLRCVECLKRFPNGGTIVPDIS